jgi:hypothetical protein
MYSKVLFFFVCVWATVLCYSADFEPYTGKISRSKVRLRLSPDLDGKVVQEAEKDDLLIVVGENEDFFAVLPPSKMKAYIFRTFVLEGVVEGTRVNVRLEPHLDSPIIAQLNSGDRIEGEVCAENNKWLEIQPPPSVNLFVYKDYITKVGDIHYLAHMEERRKEINHLLNSAYLMSQEEMQKSFQDIDLDSIVSIIQAISTQYEDFPDHTKRARDLLTLIQDHYLQQKADYLEFKSQENSKDWKDKNALLLVEMETQRSRLQELEIQLIEKNNKGIPMALEKSSENLPSSEGTSSWAHIEQQLFKEWQEIHKAMCIEDFYQWEKTHAKELTGILKPYDRNVKNKPGDYLLIHPLTHLPIAFLYSTAVDLQGKLGKVVTVTASPRSDNYFAFPAYYVHQLD